jgi:hypothetical protein
MTTLRGCDGEVAGESEPRLRVRRFSGRRRKEAPVFSSSSSRSSSSRPSSSFGWSVNWN